jgi:hypothetical protein
VPIDRALAEGCKLSDKLPDLDSARQRHDRFLDKLELSKTQRRQLTAERDLASSQLAPLQQLAIRLSRQLQAAERAQSAHSSAWYHARQLIDEVTRLETLLVEQERTQMAVAHLDTQIQQKAERAAAFRDEHAQVFTRLSHFFAAIVAEIISSQATGKASLDGKGLSLSIDLGGDRSTAAIDSLKVIAFDLAVMCMSIEGDTHLPAFLIHDSPREADLGLSVYHRLFHLVERLEQSAEKPAFQYIITTTTAPPKELAADPWLCARLGGAADARLLKRDL